ncbi:MAG: HNH endonuclease [Firmicutes bacterium]|nr:HNH endonuclease [Bacillota bacterium]
MKEWARAFYLSPEWRATREAYAAAVGWLCEDCLSRGLYVPGKVVHHVTPLTPENIRDPKVSLAWNNLRLVCQDCHAEEHRRNDGKRYRIMADGTVAPKP